jgi:hypothetical protein
VRGPSSVGTLEHIPQKHPGGRIGHEIGYSRNTVFEYRVQKGVQKGRSQNGIIR